MFFVFLWGEGGGNVSQLICFELITTYAEYLHIKTKNKSISYLKETFHTKFKCDVFFFFKLTIK